MLAGDGSRKPAETKVIRTKDRFGRVRLEGVLLERKY